MMMSVFVLGAQAQGLSNAPAQGKVINVKEEPATTTECKKLLSTTGADTLVVIYNPAKQVEGGKFLYRVRFFVASDGRVKRVSDFRSVEVKSSPILVYDAEELGGLELKADEARLAFELAYRGRYAMDEDHFLVRGTVNDGKIPAKFSRKYGFSAFPYIGWQSAGSNVGGNAIIAGAGAEWDNKHFLLEGKVGMSRTTYSSKAEHAGQNYTAFTGSLGGGVKLPFGPHKYGVYELRFKGGIDFEHYKTDSHRETGLWSKGNNHSPYGEVEFKLRPRNSNFAYSLSGGWKQKVLVLQNEDKEYHSSIYVTGKVFFELGRRTQSFFPAKD